MGKECGRRSEADRANPRVEMAGNEVLRSFPVRHRRCRGCGARFLWTAEEQAHARARGWKRWPRRCPALQGAPARREGRAEKGTTTVSEPDRAPTARRSAL
jgi:hypothetical protein